MKFKTDIDRLHDVIEGRRRGRGAGKTFAKCYDVLGWVQVGESYIYCMVTRYNDLTYILPILEQILEEHGFRIAKFNGVQNELSIVNSKIKFVVEEDWEHRMRGLRGAQVLMRHQD